MRSARLSRKDLTEALRKRWTAHRISKTDGTIWLKRGNRGGDRQSPRRHALIVLN